MSKDIQKTVYFVRHGETHSNVDSIVQGLDDELTQHGLIQAKAIAERCASLDVDTLFSSDAVRTKQTTDEILKYVSLKPIYSALFTPNYETLKAPIQ